MFITSTLHPFALCPFFIFLNLFFFFREKVVDALDQNQVVIVEVDAGCVSPLSYIHLLCGHFHLS